MTIRSVWVLLASFLLFAGSAFGWGEKGHGIANEAATYETPTEIPLFFHEAYARLVYLGYDPDRWRGAGDSLDAVNPPDHFLDYEYVENLELPVDRYSFIKLLYESGTLDRLGIPFDRPGFLPWRITELCEKLERQWRIWRTATLDPSEREQVEESIIQIAGVLGHYVADSANPHHATIHYNGWVGDPGEGYANDCDIHSRFETRFVTRYVGLSDVVPLMFGATRRGDYFAASLALIRESSANVEALYELDREGAFDPKTVSEEGRAFAAGRLAVGASLLRDLWWSTWLASAESRNRRGR